MQIISGSVEIKHINLNDTTYKISTEESTDSLIESINNVRLISPPILQQVADNNYIVVSGFRRVNACRFLKWQHVDARVINDAENQLALLKLAIADNSQNRELNVIEQAVSLSKLSAFYTDPVALIRESQKIGLNFNPGLIKKLRKINSANDLLKDKVATGIVPFSIALKLSEMDEDTVNAFMQIIETLHPTLNHQKEIIRLSTEISRLKNISILAVIKDPIFINTIKDPDLDRKQKIVIIRQHLKQIRYPEIVRFESNYLSCLQRMKLPESIYMNPPADFEGNKFSMVLNFQNLSQFIAANQFLQELQNHPDFAKILEKDFEDN